MTKCKICGNSDGNTEYTAREMMFGMRDEFKYIQCGSCGCVQICDIPEDMSKYYPSDSYCSFSVDKDEGLRASLRKRLFLIRHRMDILDKRSILVSLVKLFRPQFGFNDTTAKYKVLKNLPRNGILDVGCGAGVFLDELAELGFTDLHGVDLFIEKNLTTRGGVDIQKGEIFDIKNESYNVIMLHHSLEHMPEQKGTIEHIAKLLRPDGTCIIAIPIVNYAWEVYKTDWVQLDPPRHFFLHTVKSMNILLRDTGLFISDILYDSSEFQFIGSEGYKKGIPLNHKYDLAESRARLLYKKKLRSKVDALNKEGKGDQAIFLLKRCK
ncbi:putative methyltransferase [Synergistales bacterium]|nr:putative methyltransferase [Synergistales bacterium]